MDVLYCTSYSYLVWTLALAGPAGLLALALALARHHQPESSLRETLCALPLNKKSTPSIGTQTHGYCHARHEPHPCLHNHQLCNILCCSAHEDATLPAIFLAGALVTLHDLARQSPFRSKPRSQSKGSLASTASDFVKVFAEFSPSVAGVPPKVPCITPRIRVDTLLPAQVNPHLSSIHNPLHAVLYNPATPIDPDRTACELQICTAGRRAQLPCRLLGTHVPLCRASVLRAQLSSGKRNLDFF